MFLEVRFDLKFNVIDTNLWLGLSSIYIADSVKIEVMLLFAEDIAIVSLFFIINY